MIYKKYETEGVVRYRNDKGFLKPERIPAEVLENFKHTDSVEYDDQPDKARCLFCDAPETHQRTINVVAHAVDLKTIELCDYHYYNQSLGSLVAKYRLNQQEKQDERQVPKRSKSKGRKPKVASRVN
jgi:hypothetical protein